MDNAISTRAMTMKDYSCQIYSCVRILDLFFEPKRTDAKFHQKRQRCTILLVSETPVFLCTPTNETCPSTNGTCVSLVCSVNREFL